MASSSASNLEIRYQYPDSSPYAARVALRQSAKQLTDRGLTSSAKWALELLAYVPKPEFDDVKSPRTTAADMADFRFATDTPAHRREKVSPVYPIQSTPAVGQAGDGSGRFDSIGIPPSPLPGSTGSGGGMGSISNIGSSSNIESNRVLQPLTPLVPASSNSSASAHVRFAATETSGNRSQADTSMAAYTDTWDMMNEDEEDVYMLAKNLFDHHQWERSAALLERHKVRGAKALFLKLYARYLLVERQAEEDYFQVARKTRGKSVHRTDLLPLLRELLNPSDTFLFFLKGIMFRKLGKRIEAIDCFLRSLETFPYNWGAWQELCACLEGGRAELQEIASMLPNSFMTSFFCELFARSAAARLQSDEALRRIDSLLRMFPNSPYLLVSRGQTLHLMQELEASEAAYEAARAVDPHRLDGMADYSNSLFVQNKEEKLAHLTHSLAEAGREDAEVCCAIGNYHTLRGDNHRAVEVFKRGVRLDPSCASAWILLGHGYIELKDSMAAAEMYRKALELNPRDVRAWTGLGNTYELNGAWAQALHYHKKAAATSPYDFRFWASMANCYEKLSQPVQAIECYKRILALEHSVDAQLAIMDNIARLYEGLAGGDEEEEEEEEADARAAYANGDDSAAHARDLLRACAWHRRIVELIDRARNEEDSAEHAARVKEHVGSFLIAARWEMGMVTFGEPESTQEEIRPGATTVSSMELDNGLSKPRIGNINLAREYLQRVIMTGTEATLEAEELMKKVALLQT